jgi:transcriptional regulator
MTKYSQQQIIEACELREQGLTYAAIGRRVGMNPASVLEYCQMHGAVAPNCTKQWAAPTFDADVDAEIVRLRQSGMGQSKIARTVNRPLKSVRNRLRSLAFNEAKAEAAA